jgi:hypothetical protein
MDGRTSPGNGYSQIEQRCKLPSAINRGGSFELGRSNPSRTASSSALFCRMVESFSRTSRARSAASRARLCTSWNGFRGFSLSMPSVYAVTSDVERSEIARSGTSVTRCQQTEVPGIRGNLQSSGSVSVEISGATLSGTNPKQPKAWQQRRLLPIKTVPEMFSRGKARS